MQISIQNEEQKKSLWKAGGWSTTATFQLSPEERAALTGNVLNQQIPISSFYSGPNKKWHTFNEPVTLGQFFKLCYQPYNNTGYVSLFSQQAAGGRGDEKLLLDLLTLLKLRLQNSAPPDGGVKRYEI